MTARYIAIDWGSTNLRAWLYQGDKCLEIPLSRHLFELIAHDVINWTVPDDFYISVNISPAHLMDDGFIQ
ncbi:hypothetical protein ONQ62_28045, partial [Salmonella enterica subsp. enterica serovar Virginia]|nr:hypothetical protein [Salmonella enterica subsp. enterica serovar Virginia]